MLNNRNGISTLLLLFAFCTLSSNAQEIKWKDTSKVKATIHQLIKNANQYTIAQFDSIFSQSINQCEAANLQLWKIRILNYWSQQKVSQNDFAFAKQLILQAYHSSNKVKGFLQTEDYRDVLTQLVQVYFYLGEVDSSKYYNHLAYNTSLQAKDDFNASIAATMRVSIKVYYERNFDNAFEEFENAYAIALKTETKHDDVMALHNYAETFMSSKFNDIKGAMQLYLSMQPYIGIKELQQNTTLPYQRVKFFYRNAQSVLLKQISTNYFLLHDYENAVRYARAFFDQIKMKTRAYQPLILCDIAKIETFVPNNFARVKQLVDTINLLAKKYLPNKNIANPNYYFTLGWLKEQENQFQKTIQYYQHAIQEEKLPGATEAKAALLRVLVKTKNLKAAHQLINEVNPQLNQSFFASLNTLWYRELAEYFKATGAKYEAAEAQLQYYQLKDSLAGISNYLTLSALESQYQTREKDKIIALTQSENQLKEKALQLTRNISYLLGFGVLVVVGFLIWMSRINKKIKHQSELLVKRNFQVETLIRELHHRVKNNLQVVSSLLSLQSNRLDDDAARDALEVGKSRVDAIAMIHQKLYLDDELAAIDIRDYLHNLSSTLAQSFGYEASIVHIQVNLEQVMFDIDKAIPLGLILNELLTNAFKHAFNQIQDPKVNIFLKSVEKELILTIEDNGIGMNEHTQKKSQLSFGMKLVATLVKQLKGRMEINATMGTKIKLTLPLC